MKRSSEKVSCRTGTRLSKFAILLLASIVWPTLASAQKWIQIPTQFTAGWADLLLTDGRVLIQDFTNSGWWALTPKQYTLDYDLGTFTKVGSLPAGYCPYYFASAVLPDGRAIVEGGEDNSCGTMKGDSNLGAIFNPKTNKWSAVAAPAGWTTIGDAESVVLPDGTFMLANCCSTEAALLDAKTLTWTVLTPASGYKNKNDGNDEEGWTLLPDGNVLTVDAYVGYPCSSAKDSEIYNPSTGSWSTAGSTKVQLWDSRLACGCKGSNEIGPAVLLPGGNVFATGADTCLNSMGKPVAGHTALYDTATGVWTAGPDFPNGNDIADGPAALLPNGHVLVDTNPGYGNKPDTFYAYNPSSGVFLAIPQPPGLDQNTEGGRMLLLPSGALLFTQAGYNYVWFFEPAGTYEPAWQPHICSACYPAIAYIGKTYTVSGTQFNGLSQGSYFGDDGQSATNYPIAVITNDATGHKFFARTHDFSTMGVATGTTMVSAQFDVLPGTETGNSTLVVITNGIPSNTVGIVVGEQSR